MFSFALASLRRAWVFAFSLILLFVPSAKDDPSRVVIAAEAVGLTRIASTKLPLIFEPNLGQADPRVEFLSRGRGYTLFLTKDEAALVMQKPERRSQESGVRNPKIEARSAFLSSPARSPQPKPPFFLDLKLLRANSAAKVTGANELAGKSNYFIGNDPKKWRTNVPTYGRVRYESIYPGVDLEYYGNQDGQLEYDFVVASGADPGAITLAIEAEGRASSRQKPVGSGQSSEVGCPPPLHPSSAEEGSKTTFPSLLRRGPGGGCSCGAESLTTDHGVRAADSTRSKILNLKSKIASSLHIAPNGDLIVALPGGELRFHKPVVYQTESRVESQESKVEPGQRATDHRQPASANLKSKIENPELKPRATDHRRLTSANPKSKIQNLKLIDGRYVLRPEGEVSFETAPYDRTLPLIIDPVLSYSTYLGGSDMDYANGIAVDSSGNAYVTGYTASTNFPLANPEQSSPGGGTCSDGVDTIACFDAFVTKLNPAGTALVYSTYLGGSDEDYGTRIALDANGDAYVTGYTNSTDFPVQNALQSENAGGYDAFVTELSADGASLLYSTYWGGSLDDMGTGIAVDSSGNAYVSGYTASPDFPINPGALQTNYGGGVHNGFVVKFNSGGAQLGYSTFLGGSGDDYAYGVAVDSAGDAYVTGATYSTNFPTVNAFQPNYAGGLCGTAPSTFPCYDAFVAKLNPAGAALIFSTYLGGTGSDYGYAIALDGSSNAYLTGYTTSTNFPTTPGAFQQIFGGSYDAFVAKLNGAGSTLVYSTYLGGAGTEVGYDVAVDSSGRAFVTGYNYGGAFPTVCPLQAQNAGFYDAFISVLNATGSSLAFSTYLGGSLDEEGYGIALDPSGNAYVTGGTFSLDFPITPGSYQPSYAGGPYDAFVAEVSLVPSPCLSISPPSYQFGNQAVGTPSAPQTATLTNTGAPGMTVTSVVASGDFAETDTCVSSSPIAANGTCSVSVTFTPTAPGTRNGALTITDNATLRPQTVPLTGTGVGPAASLSPASLSFVDQADGTTSVAETAMLLNTGNVTLNVTSVAITGTNSSDFAESNNCGSSLTPGASCTLNVTFTPTLAGLETGTLTITDNASPATQTLSLTGTGTAPAISLSPASLTFPAQALGTSSSPQTVTLSNTGNAALSITSISTSGDFSETNTCGSSVAATASCNINVTFKPTAGGTRTGAVTISDNAGASPQTVALTGTAEDFTLTVASGSSSSASVSQGQVASYTLSIEGVGGLDQTVNFTCTGAPSEASCTVSPNPVTLNGSAATNVTVTVDTTAPSGVALQPRLVPPLVPGQPAAWLLCGMLLMAASLVWGIVRRPDPEIGRLRVGLLTLGALLLLTLGVAACGGGGTGLAPPSNPGTPVGTYTLTVTGTCPLGSTTLSHSVNLTLQVQ
jgi:hypothetical protein